MTTSNEPLAIVPNGDSDDYNRLLSDLQRERMLRVEAQTERDELLWALRWSNSGKAQKTFAWWDDDLREEATRERNNHRVLAILARYEAKETK